ncbi:zinc finger MYM-type protein 1-like [Ctenocephalides felis]|uniref:zinc finger MYM-type protein 1-like n=1 Tax=Ctenocephalides felis TaxID=7515 RepID=UPI000E6E150A|nr:zinc finger MYM-type protein 1-like [Ctenocephalides felis]
MAERIKSGEMLVKRETTSKLTKKKSDDTSETCSSFLPKIEENQIDDSEMSEDSIIFSSDRGSFGDNLTEFERKTIFKLGPFKPQGPFPKDLETDRRSKSYSSAWVNGVSIRSNFTQTLLEHEKSQQHINASLSHNNWLQGNTIDTQLSSEINCKITFWKDVLHRIINVIITLASCNLPLRGHDSDSENFMSILRLLSNYDAVLKELLLNPKGAINYLSPLIQNEIISLLGTAVRNNIISEIKKAPFLTIILDTTQDLSKIDQLSLVFRYISIGEDGNNVPKELKICQSFLRFVAVNDSRAEGLKIEILSIFNQYGIDLTKCRGQGYDGANVMSSVYGGLQFLIKEHAPNADYVHCAAHALNLVLNDAAKHVREVSTFFDNLEKIYTFFGNSIQRWSMLNQDSSEEYLVTLKRIMKNL